MVNGVALPASAAKKWKEGAAYGKLLGVKKEIENSESRNAAGGSSARRAPRRLTEHSL